MALPDRVSAVRIAGLLLGLVLSSAAPQQAKAVPILPGETLRVEFGISSAPDIGIPQLPSNHPWRVPTVLFGFLNVTRLAGFGQPSATFALYDGDDLLGSFSINFDGFTTFGFSAPGGLFTFRAGSVTDFSSIADGTIDGVLLITNASPVDLDLSAADLEVGHATQSNGFIPFSPLAVITSQGPWTPIAEPATSAAMLAGLLAIGFGRRRLKAAAPKY